MSAAAPIPSRAARLLLERNPVYEDFFAAQADRLAQACREMAQRFLAGGRLLAFGRGVYATDAQHVSVEFVHPVIVGKRALPALDLSMLPAAAVETLVRPSDIAMGFAPPEGDSEIAAILASARRAGAMTFALPGSDADYAIGCAASPPFQHQEIIEILYHTLWETVHVFFEHHELPSEAGDAGFLYPFLNVKQPVSPGNRPLTEDVAASIRAKVCEDARLRARAAEEESAAITRAAAAISARVRSGGKLINFGNGGSATDANDFALDCLLPPPGFRPIPAISLSAEPAILSALANDVGPEVIFLRQLIAHAQPADIAIAISTSGGSRNLLAALEEARRRSLLTVALLGYDGGEILRRGLADHPIVVRSDYIPRIQEVQASIYHVIRELLECPDA
jgi:D-sedoheptulose 7-phosphate isomerase